MAVVWEELIGVSLIIGDEPKAYLAKHCPFQPNSIGFVLGRSQ